MAGLFTHSGQRPAMECATSELSALSDGRGQARRHLFVAATLYWESGSGPVRIRNMSQTGALIEAASVPEPDCAVTLMRGSLKAQGRIAWKARGKAGIAFSTNLILAEWMMRQVPAHQGRVDEIVSSLRAGAPPAVAVCAPNPANSALIEAELTALRTELVALGNGLTTDGILVATHPEIQMIDVIVQRVDRIAGKLGDPRP